MFCKRCGMHIHHEDPVNYGMCEKCFDEFLESDDDVTIKEFIDNYKK